MSAALTTNVDARQLRATKFPPEFNEKVDMSKVNSHIIKKWVTDTIAKILQDEDDIVTELVNNMIEKRHPNIKELQIALTGFLDKDAASFCRDLWKLCLSAQQSPQGIPKELLEAKKQELAQSRLEEERAREEAKSRQALQLEHDRHIESIRDRERDDRRSRGGRNGRDFDRPPRFRSRSPPPRRRRDDNDYYRAPPPARNGDVYRPGHRTRRGRPPSRSRSPPRYKRRQPSASRSRSPPRRRRNHSSSLSRSRDRRRERSRSHDRHRRSRSPLRKRRRERSQSVPVYSRSPSPRNHRRRGSSTRRDPEDISSRSRSRSPRNLARRGSPRAPRDLMARPNRRPRRGTQESGRLSRHSSDSSPNKSDRSPPPRNRRSLSAASRSP